MGSRDDDERAYRTSEDMVGRSIRRGTRKAIKALTFGALGGDVASGAATHLASDAAREAAEAYRRSSEKGR